MNRKWWIILVPSAISLIVGFAFVRMRLLLDRAESISRVASSANELNQSALTCLNRTATHLISMRSALPDLSSAAIDRTMNESLGAGEHCESAVFATTNRELITSMPKVAREKYSSLPFWAWGPPDRSAATGIELPVVEGPYESASQDWYVSMRVPCQTGSDAWIAAVVPVNMLFDQLRMKKIIDMGFSIHVLDSAQSAGKNVNLLSFGSFYFPLFRQNLSIGRNTILVEFSPAVNAAVWQSGLLYGSLVLVLAAFTSVTGYEMLAEQRRLRTEVRRRDTRVKDLKSQLNQAMKGATNSNRFAIGASFQDAVTGLPNWLFFSHNLDRALARLKRNQQIIVVLSELDYLPQLQRRLDSEDIESLLKQVVERFDYALRADDLIATRLAQGEFAFLRFERDNGEPVESLSRQLEDSLEQPFLIGEKTVILQLRSGSANSQAFSNGQGLIEAASLELLRAKLKEEKPDIVDHSDTSDPRENRELADVKSAIERDELRLDFLPVVSLRTRRLLGLEVLVRWHHPYKGIIAPSRFIPVAEAAGHGILLTKWVLNESIQQMARWRQTLTGIDDVHISVNLTPHEFGRPGLLSLIQVLLEETRLPASHLHLELEEEVLGGDVKKAVDLSNRMREVGLKLVFEEFGASQSALSSLRLIKWDSVKVARMYGGGFTGNPENERALRAVTHMAQDFGIACVAKGVEVESSVVDFINLGYESGQGFLFSRPLSAASTEALLRDSARGAFGN